ncbi:MAG: hypothetical protein O6952_09650, partial [Planctomycetota bacterium]|nr:hypothetical protein [Planctomycetota bacterium]
DGFATGSTIPVNGIGPGPITAVESAFETFLYVGNTGSSTVTVIDSLTDQVVTSALVRESFPDPSGITSIRLPTGLDLVLVSCSGDGSVRVVDVNALHSPFATVQRAAIDPRGITALATHFGSRAYVVDTSSGEVGQIDLDLLEATGMGFPLPPIPGLGTGILDVTSVH